MSPANFVQADLRFLLPIQANQQVAIWGYIPELVEAISDAQAHCTLILPLTQPAAAAEGPYDQVLLKDKSLPLAQASMDHVFIPQLATTEASWLINEVKRVLKPGGWLFIGVRNRFSLYQMGFKQKQRYALTLGKLQHLFALPEWEIKQCYGVHEDLQSPQFLISLANPETARYFYDQIFMPHSQTGAWAQRLALRLSKMGGQRFLFRDLGLVAQHF